MRELADSVRSGIMGSTSGRFFGWVVGGALPLSPLSGVLGFRALPIGFFVTLGALVVIYLLLIELAKRAFFAGRSASRACRRRGAGHRLHRRASRFTHSGPL